MKTIIAGSRTYTGAEALVHVTTAAERVEWVITEVVSGNCKAYDDNGRELLTIDRAGERWADVNDLPVSLFPANWEEHGDRAGPIRNDEMAEYADALIAVWDGESFGTEHMIRTARRRGLKVHVYEPESTQEALF